MKLCQYQFQEEFPIPIGISNFIGIRTCIVAQFPCTVTHGDGSETLCVSVLPVDSGEDAFVSKSVSTLISIFYYDLFLPIEYLHQMCAFSTPRNPPILCGHQLGVLQFSSVLTLSTQS